MYVLTINPGEMEERYFFKDKPSVDEYLNKISKVKKINDYKIKYLLIDHNGYIVKSSDKNGNTFGLFKSNIF